MYYCKPKYEYFLINLKLFYFPGVWKGGYRNNSDIPFIEKMTSPPDEILDESLNIIRYIYM